MTEFLITFCVVAYNEEKNLGRLLENVYSQSYSHNLIEVILVDSGSIDATRNIMEQFQNKYSQEFYGIQVLNNPKRTLPAGWNIVLEHYHGDAVVRVDAHAEIPKDFLEKNVIHLEAGDFICGGYRPNIIDEDTPWKRVLLAAETSAFGSSFADFRRKGKNRSVSSVFHGAYKREVFEQVGNYNEMLIRTEDNEIHYRMRKAGYKIQFYPDIISYEHTRNTIRKMIRQKYENGYWIGKTLGIVPECISFFYLVPLFFIIGIAITGILTFFGLWQAGVLMWAIYGITCISMTLAIVWIEPKSSLCFVLLPAIFFIIHISYGIGTSLGLIQILIKKGE